MNGFELPMVLNIIALLLFIISLFGGVSRDASIVLSICGWVFLIATWIVMYQHYFKG